jgi:hypothetical protein
MDFSASFEGPDLIKIIKELSWKEPFPSAGNPLEISVDGENIDEFSEDWREQCIPSNVESIRIEWGEYIDIKGTPYLVDSRSLVLHSKSCIKVVIKEEPPISIGEVLGLTGTVSWTLASFVDTHGAAWRSVEKMDEGTDYLGPSIGNLHYNLGWACAFKGEGHKHLASKRILDHGPWRVIRDEENDITLVQFYDLDADADTALEQAKLGHKLMGDYAHGSLMTDDNPFHGNLKGLYQTDKRKLEIVVAGRDLLLTEIIDACKAKYSQSLGPEKPIDNVAFIFTAEEEEAYKYLFDIWLRGLECWAFIDHRPVRLDEDYTPPPPQKPEWVQRLESKANRA